MPISGTSDPSDPSDLSDLSDWSDLPDPSTRADRFQKALAQGRILPPMVVSYMRVDMALPSARSLKDKRSVIRSIADKVRHSFRVSIAEVDDQDLWGNATLGIAVVGNDAAFGEAVLRKVLEFIASHPEVDVRGALSEALHVD